MDKLKEAARQAADKLKEKVEEKMAKNPLEKALNEATSDVNWNASNKVLQEIADHTYSFGDFTEVMKHIWKRLSSERKNWRRILKTLSLIEYLIKNGSPRCIQEFRDEIYQIRTLQDFSHYEDGQDRGAAIREVSKRVVTLLNDEQKIDEERKKSQELRERLGGEMKAYGSGGSSYGGTGSGSFGSSNRYDGFNSNKGFGSGSGQSKYAGGGSTTGFGSETSKGFGSDSHYDDTRKAGKWRVEKTDEPSKPSESEGYTVKSGTKYESPTAEKKEEKPAEKRAAPVIAGPGGNKTLQPPKGSKIVQQTQPQQDLLGGDDLLTGGNPAPTTNNTAGNTDLFGWDQPQQPAPTTNNNANQGQWNWAEPTGNQTQAQPQAKPQTQPQPQAQPQAQANASPFDWGQPSQNTAPQTTQPSANNIQNLYQQNQPQNQNQFGSWNNQQQNVNNLSNQLNNLNFGGNTQTQGGWGQQQQATPAQQSGFQWGQSNQSTPAPSNNFNAQPQHKNDGFDDFQVAKSTGVAGTGNDYKNYSNAEKSIIDLSDLASEANKKKETKGKIEAIKNSNEGFLYSSKEDLDNFFIAPQGGMNMQGGFNQGGMNMNMGMNQGMRPQQGGMYPNQMGMNMGMQQQQQQQQQMGMQGANFYGNQQGFNPMMGNQGGFGNPQMNQGQMGGMNNGFRF